MSFAGFDVAGYPGDDLMQWIIANTNAVFCGYYLPGAPSHRALDWTGKRAALFNMGYGFAPVFVGQQLRGPGSHRVSGPDGTVDGAQAAQLMTAEGFPPGSVVYLDLEDGPPFAEPRIAYVSAWADLVSRGGFTPGIYGSHYIGPAVAALLPAAPLWSYRVPTTQQIGYEGGLTLLSDDPAVGSGVPGAVVWQARQNTRLSLPGAPREWLIVDLDTAASADPSAPPG